MASRTRLGNRSEEGHLAHSGITLFHNQLGNEKGLSRIIKLTGASPYEAAHGEDATRVDRVDIGDGTA
jgi:hypothetical protein